MKGYYGNEDNRAMTEYDDLLDERYDEQNDDSDYYGEEFNPVKTKKKKTKIFDSGGDNDGDDWPF